jgi:hypothetical protein
MPSYNMNDYVSVAERVSQAQDKIQSVAADAPAFLTETMGYIRVTILLNDGRSATGTASFRLDLQGKGAQATNPIEDCETSAIGRALAFLGYASSKSIASREEVQEAQRREASYAPPAPKQPARPAPAKPTNGHALDADDAQQRFYARYSEIVGGQDWASVQRFLSSRAPRPTTVEGWIAAAEAVRDKANEKSPLKEG